MKKQVIAKPHGRKGDMILIREKETGNFFLVDRFSCIRQADCGNGWREYDVSNAEKIG